MSLARRLLLATLGPVMAVGAADAQRGPVLRQIKTPHAYYFREMLIPQVTTGPTSPAWSDRGLGKVDY